MSPPERRSASSRSGGTARPDPPPPGHTRAAPSAPGPRRLQAWEPRPRAAPSRRPAPSFLPRPDGRTSGGCGGSNPGNGSERRGWLTVTALRSSPPSDLKMVSEPPGDPSSRRARDRGPAGPGAAPRPSPVAGGRDRPQAPGCVESWGWAFAAVARAGPVQVPRAALRLQTFPLLPFFRVVSSCPKSPSRPGPSSWSARSWKGRTESAALWCGVADCPAPEGTPFGTPEPPNSSPAPTLRPPSEQTHGHRSRFERLAPLQAFGSLCCARGWRGEKARQLRLPVWQHC